MFTWRTWMPCVSFNEECPICLEARVLSHTVIGCAHRFCAQCADLSVCAARLRCPMCRAPFLGWTNAPHQIELCAADGEHVGVTVRNVADGVRVQRLNANDLGATRLVKGDVLLRINDFPCVDHRAVIAIINRCTSTGVPMRLIVLRRRLSFLRKSSQHIRELRSVYFRALDAAATFHPEWEEEEV